ncbi:MAG: STAS domain-containing protein [Chthonomonadales bacterium]
MILRERAINIMKLPTSVSAANLNGLVELVESFVQRRHPRIVVDCSALESVGKSEIAFLLCCLGEVMKHNGDVRLAMLKPHASVVLQRVGVSRLFETYDSVKSAVESYRVRPASMAPLQNAPAAAVQHPEIAA